MSPEPTRVRYNDWRQVDAPAPEEFTPTEPVSVVIPSWQTPPETLTMTLAALEGQTWPRDLFEVVIVDDGSEPPVEPPRSSPLAVKVVREERRGFGAARARNTGVRAAAHDILLFLDSDMLAEAGLITAHARWHHTVADALTLGFHAYVAADDLDAESIRRRTGSLEELFAGRLLAPPWTEAHMLRTDDLTSRTDDPFRAAARNDWRYSGKSSVRTRGCASVPPAPPSTSFPRPRSTSRCPPAQCSPRTWCIVCAPGWETRPPRSRSSPTGPGRRLPGLGRSIGRAVRAEAAAPPTSERRERCPPRR